jgi:hypothetical protein
VPVCGGVGVGSALAAVTVRCVLAQRTCGAAPLCAAAVARRAARRGHLCVWLYASMFTRHLVSACVGQLVECGLLVREVRGSIPSAVTISAFCPFAAVALFVCVCVCVAQCLHVSPSCPYFACQPWASLPACFHCSSTSTSHEPATSAAVTSPRHLRVRMRG